MSNWSIPPAQASDGAQVARALEAAQAELERGFEPGAARWLRCAAAEVLELGQAERAATLEALAAQYDNAAAVTEGELSDVDDFSDETIVDQAPDLALPTPRARVGVSGSAASPVTTIATAPTPLAQPPRPAQGPPVYGAVRVTVRRALGGQWQVRALGARESAPPGEEEALLVPLRPGMKFG